jgi:hypothetical protein
MSGRKPITKPKPSLEPNSGYNPKPREREQVAAYFDQQKRKPLIPPLNDDHPYAQSLRPMDMMVQG